MFRKILKHTWASIVVFSTIGGAISFLHYFFSKPDYSLTIFLKTTEELVQPQHTSGLRILYNGKEINSLYVTKIIIQNTGRLALTKNFIYKPLSISIGKDNKLIKIKQTGSGESYAQGGKLHFTWNLLNPSDSARIFIYSTNKPDIKESYKIKEIKKVSIVNEIKNPLIEKRVTGIGVFWLVLLLFSILITIDSLLLILGDVKLQKIFNYTKQASNLKSVNRKEYLDTIQTLYSDYHQSVPLLFISVEELPKLISEKIPSTDILAGKDLHLLCQETINYVRHANLYSIRSINIAVGPILFGFCLIRVALALLF